MKTNISSFILALTSIVLCSSAQRTPTLIENDFNREYFAVTNTMANAGNINTVGNAMLQFLLEMETPTQFDEQISVDTRRIITTKNNVYGLVLLERALKENQGVNFFLKEKLLNES